MCLVGDSTALCDVDENVEAFFKNGVFACVADAEVCVSLREDVAWDNEAGACDDFFDKFCCGEAKLFRNFRECVKSTTWSCEIECAREFFDDHVTLASICFDVIAHIHVGGCYGTELCHSWSTNERVLLQLGHFVDERSWANGVAKAPTGHCVGLGVATHHQEV